MPDNLISVLTCDIPRSGDLTVCRMEIQIVGKGFKHFTVIGILGYSRNTECYMKSYLKSVIVHTVYECITDCFSHNDRVGIFLFFRRQYQPVFSMLYVIYFSAEMVYLINILNPVRYDLLYPVHSFNTEHIKQSVMI